MNPSHDEVVQRAIDWLRMLDGTTEMRHESMEMIGSILFSGERERIAADRRFRLAEVCCKTFVAASKAQSQALQMAAALLDKEYEVSDEDLAAAESIYEFGIRLGGDGPPEAPAAEVAFSRKGRS